MDEHLLAAIWLQRLLGYGSPVAGDVLRWFGSPLEAYRERFSENFCQFLHQKQLDKLPDLTLEQMEPTLLACMEQGIRVLSWEDEEFPPSLADLPDPPTALYVTGDVSALAVSPKLGMVGSRRPSAYGVRVCEELGGQLAKAGVVLVSGLADGLDSQVHKASVDAGAPTIGVLGTSINVTYPVVNRRLRAKMEETGGAVISEYAPGTISGKNFFLLRNRLIAGLSDALCVVEARKQSGTMNTVNNAVRYGKTVWAVPGNVFSPLSEGTNELIASGTAKILRGAKSVLEELGVEGAEVPERPKPVPTLSATAKRLLELLGDAPIGVDAICAVTDLNAGAVLAALTELELEERIEALPGRQYRLR